VRTVACGARVFDVPVYNAALRERRADAPAARNLRHPR